MAQLGVASQVADEHDAVDVSPCGYSSSAGTDSISPASSLVPAPPRPARADGHRPAALDPTCRQVAHDAVVDLEHARDLVQRVGLAGDVEQVVDAVGLLVDLVGEPAAPPGVVAVPGAAALLGELADARDDLRLPLLGELGVQHEQNLVVVHVP